jgi:streptogramin lyase
VVHRQGCLSGNTCAIERITPSTQITEFSAGLQAGNGGLPFDITPRPDGDLWFTDQRAPPARSCGLARA